MKKLLIWLLVLTMCVGMFAGCRKQDTGSTTAPTVTAGDGLANALEYLKTMYKNAAEKTPRDYDRIGKVLVGGTTYAVAWSVDVSEDLVKVVVNENGNVTIDVNEQCEADTPYKLTATVSDDAGNSLSWTWDHLLPEAIDPGEIVMAAYALKDGESLPYEVTLTGKVISIDQMYNPDFQNITVTMVVEGYEDYPIQCYRLKGEGAENLQVGNIITVTGTIKNYKGTIEFDAGCILEAVEKGDAVDAPTDPVEIVKAAYALKRGESLPYVVTLTGKVIEIDSPFDPDYNNISVIIAVEGIENKPILCYRLKGNGVANIAVEDTITVKGIIKNYNGTIEFDSGCMMVDRISGGNIAKPPSSDAEQILKDAKKLKNGQKLDYYATLTGKVTEVVTPYDSEYQNITVKIVVNGTSLICYRLRGDGVAKIAVNDTITVKGVIENYKGTLEFGTGCTLLERISGGGVAKPESSDPVQIMKDAIALRDGQHLDYYATLTGKVIEIENPYDSEYQNITVVMTVSGYESTPITCYRLKGNGVSKIAVGDTITVRGVIENYKGTIEFGTGCELKKRISGGGVAQAETSNATKIMADAKALKDGEKLAYYATLTGKVIEIDTPYDSEYKNISVIMEVAGYEDTPIICYRLKGTGVDKIAVGDTITVRGVIENYKGTIEFGTGCELKKRVSGGGVAQAESSDPAKIMADAAALKDGEKLAYYATLTGKVAAIDSPYDSEYKNISVIMEVAGYEGTPIICYRLKGTGVDKIAVGDTITVRGVIENYKGTIEFGSGCELKKRVSGGGVAQAESSDPAKIMADAAALKDGEKLAYYATLTGKVTKIDSPYDAEYKNISVIMEVAGYEGTPIICYRLKGEGVDQIAVGDTITVRGVIENYKGTIEFGSGCELKNRVSGGGVAQAESSDPAKIIPEAYALAEGDSLAYYATLTGKVTKIVSPYDASYKNISVVMTVEGYEDKPITCYRLKGEGADLIAVNDIITVRGVIKNHYGTIEFDTGCELKNRVSGGGVAQAESSDPSKIIPEAYALAEGDSLAYYATLTGKVTKIVTPYDASYKNISVVMTVEGYEDKPITCYRLKGDGADLIAVNDTITVRGVIKNHYGTIEFDTGCELKNRVSGGGAVAQESSDPAKIIPEAYALAEGDSLAYYATLTGKVTKIVTPYDSGYKNITVEMTVAGYEDKPITCYRLKGEGADLIAVNDTITVRGVIKNHYGTIEFDTGCELKNRVSGGGAVAQESSDPAKIIPEAYALAEGDSLAYYATLTGKVTKIVTPYDSSYKNITVEMTVAGYEDKPITCYRLKGEGADLIAVNDTITVRGVIKNHYGTIEFDSGCELKNRVSGGGAVAQESSDPAKIIPDAAALAEGESLSYYATLTGKVTKIATPYDANYKNITVVMVVEGYESVPITCYRLKGEGADLIAVNDTITVRGVIKNHYGTIEFDSGCELKNRISGGGAVAQESSDPAKIIPEAYALADGESLSYYATLTGKVTAVETPYDPDFGNMTLVMTVPGYESQPITCYRLKGAGIELVALGDTITVRGVIKNYGGTIEFDTGCELKNRVSGGAVAPSPSSDEAKILADAKALTSGQKLDYFATLTGVITSVDTAYDSAHSNITVTMNVSGTSLQCYRMKANADTAAYIANLAVGDTITVKGIIENYRGKLEFGTGCILKNYVKGEGGSTGGDTPGSVNYGPLSVDTLYNLSMWQGNLGKTFHFSGAMSGDYLATSENASAAAAIYMEKVEGEGVRFYFMNGSAKTYIEIYLNSSSKPRPALNTTASVVWTYNAEAGIYTVNIDGTEYYLGTYNTFNTISASKVYFITGSNAGAVNTTQFLALFGVPGTVGGNPGGDSGDVGGDSGNTGTTDGYNFVDAPAAGTAYKFGVNLPPMDNANYYITGEMSTYYYATTTDAAAAVDVYMEAVSGGYQVYFLNGSTKTYLNVIPRENDATKVNIVYQTAAQGTPSVYTLNMEHKYLHTAVNGENYYLGTYTNSKDNKTYTTLSASKTSYISDTSKIGVSQFPAWFLSNGEGGSTPETPDVPDTPVVPDSGYSFVDAPVAGTAYKFGVNLPPMDNANYYITGEMSTYYYATTTDAAAAVDVYMEAVSGGYQIYFLNGSTKTYLNVIPRENDATKVNIVYQTASQGTPSVYTLNMEHKYLYTAVNGENYYLGTYTNSKDNKTYTTLSASKTSYISDTSKIGVSQFPAWFLSNGEGGGVTPDVPTEPTTPSTPETPDTPVVPTTPGEILEALYALGQGEEMTGTYTLTGVITYINEAYNAEFGNITVTIQVPGYEDMPVQCYHLSGEGVDQLAVTDTITVTGGLKDHYGIKEFTSGCILDSYEKGEGVVEDANKVTYNMADYAEGKQYAVNEVHALDDNITVITNKCHFAKSGTIRIYSSSTYDGNVIIQSKKVITGFSVAAGNKNDTLNVYGSVDGSTWTLIQGVSVKTAYGEYVVEIPEGTEYTQLKLDVAGSNQLRVQSFSVTTKAE